MGASQLTCTFTSCRKYVKKKGCPETITGIAQQMKRLIVLKDICLN